MFRFCCVSRPEAGAEMTGDSEIETTYHESSDDRSEEGERMSRAVSLDDDTDERVIGTDPRVAPPAIFGNVVSEEAEQEEAADVADERLTKGPAPEVNSDGEADDGGKTGPRRFEVTINRGSLGLNISVDHTGVGIQILEIKTGGAMENHNKTSPWRHRVVACDFMISVNGATSMQDMMDRITADNILTVQLIRPEPMWLSVKRRGQPWGLNLTYQNISSHIEIAEVIEGAIDDYNKTASADVQVRAKDFIESINGLTGVEKMVNCLKMGTSEIVLKVLRLGL